MVQSTRGEWEGRNNFPGYKSFYLTLALKAKTRKCLGMPVLSKKIDTSVSLLKIYRDSEEVVILSMNYRELLSSPSQNIFTTSCPSDTTNIQ